MHITSQTLVSTAASVCGRAREKNLERVFSSFPVGRLACGSRASAEASLPREARSLVLAECPPPRDVAAVFSPKRANLFPGLRHFREFPNTSPNPLTFPLRHGQSGRTTYIAPEGLTKGRQTARELADYFAVVDTFSAANRRTRNVLIRPRLPARSSPPELPRAPPSQAAFVRNRDSRTHALRRARSYSRCRIESHANNSSAAGEQ